MHAPLGHWPASWPLLLGYAVLAAAHLAGLRPVLAAASAEPGGRAARLREAACFQAGLLFALLAVISPIGYWSARLMWVRGIQDLLLAIAVPALIVLGAPWQPLRAAWPARGRTARSAAADQAGSRASAAGRPVPRHPLAVRCPVAAVAAFNLGWIGWHLPGLYDASRSGPLAWLEWLTYLAAGTLLWLQLIGSRPLRPAFPPVARFGLLAATVVVD